MQTTYDFAGSTDMWSTSAGGHLMKVVNLTGFTVPLIHRPFHGCLIHEVLQPIERSKPTLPPSKSIDNYRSFLASCGVDNHMVSD